MDEVVEAGGIARGKDTTVAHQEKFSLRAKNLQKHTATSIRWWSPTQLLIGRSEACLWQSGRDADYSSVCGRMYLDLAYTKIYY